MLEIASPFTQAIFLLLMHAIEWLTYYTNVLDPSVQSYINQKKFVTKSQKFVIQPLNRMRQNEKHRHKNHLCKRALRIQPRRTMHVATPSLNAFRF